MTIQTHKTCPQLEIWQNGLPAIDFGPVKLTKGQQCFLERLNAVILTLCESLPQSSRSTILLFLMQHAGLAIGDKLNFFRKYYPPAWSILYWLIQSGPHSQGLKAADIDSALVIHAITLKLHALDDHLNDGQVPATHTALLLRSQYWLMLNQAAGRLTNGIADGNRIVGKLLNDYYESIYQFKEALCLDSYCRGFENQMATWLIAPYLLGRHMRADNGFIRRVREAYLCFGTAWRLLDDINDIRADLKSKTHSAVYICMDNPLKSIWDSDSSNASAVYEGIERKGIIPRLIKRITSLLDKAASQATACHLDGLANELACLSKIIIYERGNRDD
jgi:hypothetical protein